MPKVSYLSSVRGEVKKSLESSPLYLLNFAKPEEQLKDLFLLNRFTKRSLIIAIAAGHIEYINRDFLLESSYSKLTSTNGLTRRHQLVMFESPSVTRGPFMANPNSGVTHGGDDNDGSAKQLRDELRASLLFNRLSSGFQNQDHTCNRIMNGSSFLDDYGDYDGENGPLLQSEDIGSDTSGFSGRPFEKSSADTWGARRKSHIAGGENTPLKITLDEMSLGRLKGHRLLASARRRQQHTSNKDAPVKKRLKKDNIKGGAGSSDVTQTPDYLAPGVFGAMRIQNYDQQFGNPAGHYHLASPPPSGNLILAEYPRNMTCRASKDSTNDSKAKWRKNHDRGPGAKTVSPESNGSNTGDDEDDELFDISSPRKDRWDNMSHVSESDLSSLEFEARNHTNTASNPSILGVDLNSDASLQEVDDMGQESIDYTIFGSLFELENIWKALVHATKKLVARRLAMKMVPQYTRSLLKAIERGIAAYRFSTETDHDEDNECHDEMIKDSISAVADLVSTTLTDVRNLILKSKDAPDSQSLGRRIEQASHFCRELLLVVFPKMVKLLDECLCRYLGRRIKSERNIAQAIKILQCITDIARRLDPRDFRSQHFLRSQLSNYSLDVGYLLPPLMLAFQCERKRLGYDEWLKQDVSLSASDLDSTLFAPRRPWIDPEGYALVHGLRIHRGLDRYARILRDSPVLKERNVSEMQGKAREIRNNYKRAREDEGRPLDPERWRWLLDV